jgi:hypothetical protein
MTMMAVAFPILPGKTDQWREFIGELNGARRAEFVASREEAGVRERTFLQPTPMGDLVIVSLEGDDPARSFAQMTSSTSAFATWFGEQAQAIHGVDPAAAPTASPSEMVIDSAEVAALAR